FHISGFLLSITHAIDRPALAPGEVAELHSVVAPVIAGDVSDVLFCDDLRGLDPAGEAVVAGATATPSARCADLFGRRAWGVKLDKVAAGLPVVIDLPVRLGLGAAGAASAAQAFQGDSACQPLSPK